MHVPASRREGDCVGPVAIDPDEPVGLPTRLGRVLAQGGSRMRVVMGR